eukprot:CCRYP_000298-RD/>CCRYP_000298-RD protein AED:0.06 eAED:0.06 QI:5/1/1/1/0.75/0.6/5/498/883
MVCRKILGSLSARRLAVCQSGRNASRDRLLAVGINNLQTIWHATSPKQLGVSQFKSSTAMSSGTLSSIIRASSHRAASSWISTCQKASASHLSQQLCLNPRPSVAGRSITTQIHRSRPHNPALSPLLQQRPNSTSASPPFRKILIANRGEIALRVMRTARSHNIPTVAIYSTADAQSLHVAMADEAVCIGGAASSDSYLNIDKVCEAIDLCGAEAVHPGYGFLSENSGFAERVEAMNVNESVYGSSGGSSSNKKVKFVGPSKHAIQSLGDKIQSKLIADAAGVSTIPGFNGVVQSPAHAVEIARSIGYPVMIKASSGGGGKGMRICYTDAQVEEGYRLGSAEAKSFFGDDRLLVEKYVVDPHHIEIQVLSGRNAKGDLDILCFAERECSVQRRNQKVLEESPSAHLLPETRREMIRQVKSLVREVGYESAGTVEFLVDKDQNFYFLEMNTRLQVEHPVTEMISGDGYASGNYVDLVHGMLEVAAGRGIPQKYLDMVDHSEDERYGDGGEGANVRYTGHAIEARVYAEDPLRGFLPSTGPLVKYVEPPALLNVGSNLEPCHIRIDTGVVPGTIVSPYYDPILSKIIAYSPVNRTHSILGLGSALDQYVIKGVQHNVPFCRDVLRNDDFIQGYTPTGFIAQHYPDGFSGGQLSEVERKELAVIAREIARKRCILMGSPPLALTGKGGDNAAEDEVVVCLGGMFGDAYLVKSKIDLERDCSITASVTRLQKEGDAVDESHVVELCNLDYELSGDLAQVSVGGKDRALQIHEEDETGTMKLTMFGSDAHVMVMSLGEYELARLMKKPIPKDWGNFVLSPMPGTLISFAVKEGDVVEIGQELCVVEAMKMQNVIRSHKAGAKVSKLHGEVGASLRADECLIEFEKAEA